MGTDKVWYIWHTGVMVIGLIIVFFGILYSKPSWVFGGTFIFGVNVIAKEVLK